jgi:hypothetical protein
MLRIKTRRMSGRGVGLTVGEAVGIGVFVLVGGSSVAVEAGVLLGDNVAEATMVATVGVTTGWQALTINAITNIGAIICQADLLFRTNFCFFR